MSQDHSAACGVLQDAHEIIASKIHAHGREASRWLPLAPCPSEVGLESQLVALLRRHRAWRHPTPTPGPRLFAVASSFPVRSLETLRTTHGESWRWILDAGAYLPSCPASTLTSPGADIVPSALALAGWVAAPLLLGWATLRTRDA